MTLKPPGQPEGSFGNEVGRNPGSEEHLGSAGDARSEEEIQSDEQAERAYEKHLIYRAKWMLEEAGRVAATALPRKPFDLILSTKHMENIDAADANMLVLGWKISRAMPPEIINGIEYPAFGLFLSLSGQLWVFGYKNPYPYKPEEKLMANATAVLDTVECFFEPRRINGCRPYVPEGGRLDIAEANIDNIETRLGGFRYSTVKGITGNP